MEKLVPLLVLALGLLFYYSCSNCNLDPESIRDKRVFITGASSGIGEHLAYQYSKLGARVFITARRASLLEQVAKKCQELGAKQVEYVASDLGDELDRDRVISEVHKRFGGLDHLILNHAIVNTGLWLGTKENMTTLLKDLNVNFVSYVDLTSLALPMLQESRGSIGVVSSIAGKFGTAGSASYVCDKHALQGFFSALRQELYFRNTGVSVTLAIIGPVDTDIMKWSEEHKQYVQDRFFSRFDARETPENTAVAILNGVANRKYEIYFGRLAWVMTTIHKIIPEYFEYLASKHFLQIEGIQL